MTVETALISQETAAQISKQAKAKGLRVVTTNGIFDVLHVGHVSYLQQAAKKGDIFIVAINSDESTKRLKGRNRPINTAEDRATVLAALKGIDYVTVFEEDDPSGVLDKIKPDLHTKAGDYEPDNMPETKIVKSHGGEVEIIPLVAGYSNTLQFKKISKRTDDFSRPDWIAKEK